jgi:two-component system chemotaxis sensor kinase CheA
VNFTSIQNATAIDEATSPSGRMKEWSLEGIEGANASRNEETTPAPLQSPSANISPTDGNSQDNPTKSLEIQFPSDDNNESTDGPAAGENQNQNNFKTAAETEEENAAVSEIDITPPAQEETSTAIEGNPAADDSAPEPRANIDETLHKKIEIPLPAIDIIQNRAKDLVVLQSILEEHKEFFTTPLLQKTVAQLSKVVQEMQSVAEHLRDVSMESSFSGWRKLIEDLATTQRKDIQLTFKNESTRLDVDQLDILNAAVLYYLRHTVEKRIVHADESMVIEDARPTHLLISAQRKPHALVVEVRDDIVRTEEGADHITAEALSKLREAAVSMHGTFEIQSNSNAGATIQFIIPQRLDVTDGLVVRLGNERFVIQKSKVAETLPPQEADVYVVQGQTQILNLRGMTVPLLNLADLLQREAAPSVSMDTFSGLALINLENSRQPFAVVVEEILTEQRIVVRKLGAELQGLPGLAGAAVLGDGKPAILLDLMELMNAHRSGYLMRRQGKAA